MNKLLPPGEEMLRNWDTLQEYLRSATEADCERIMNMERRSANRHTFIMRIHARINRLRARRERGDLLRQKPMK